MGIKAIVSLVNCLLPKRNLILFNSFPDFSGNAWALYSYIMQERPDIVQKYDIAWSVAKDTKRKQQEKIKQQKKPGTGLYVKKSVSGIWTYCRARYVITTHNYFTGVKTAGRQIHINLWHGMPLKKIGTYLDGESEHDDIQGDVTIATGEMFRQVMARAFDMEEEKVLVTGQPCNDLLFHGKNALNKIGIKKESYTKILMWMPTYRASVVGEIRSDGDKDAFGVVGVMTEEFDRLDALLKEKGYLLLIKPHPMDVICTMELKNSENIRVVTNTRLYEKDVDLYELLGQMDGLITDYSSVYVDYLILGRPVAFLCSDLKAYEESRGFCFPDILSLMPGTRIYDKEGFFRYLDNMDQCNDEWKQERERLCALFYRERDGHSAKRVCDSLFKKE